jgi:hypothetical protein
MESLSCSYDWQIKKYNVYKNRIRTTIDQGTEYVKDYVIDFWLNGEDLKQIEHLFKNSAIGILDLPARLGADGEIFKLFNQASSVRLIIVTCYNGADDITKNLFQELRKMVHKYDCTLQIYVYGSNIKAIEEKIFESYGSCVVRFTDDAYWTIN